MIYSASIAGAITAIRSHERREEEREQRAKKAGVKFHTGTCIKVYEKRGLLHRKSLGFVGDIHDDNAISVVKDVHWAKVWRTNRKSVCNQLINDVLPSLEGSYISTNYQFVAKHVPYLPWPKWQARSFLW